MVEPPAVIGGRYAAALGMLLALVLICSPGSPVGNSLVGSFAPEPIVTNQGEWQPGQTSEVRVTLITADFGRLACAHAQAFDEVHCEFKGPEERWPKGENEPLDDNKKNVIQPYRTAPDNLLVMLSGLWATPDVAMRLHEEPAIGVPMKELARFTAKCEVEWLGALENVQTRWAAGAPWQSDGRAMVGRAKSCIVEEM